MTMIANNCPPLTQTSYSKFTNFLTAERPVSPTEMAWMKLDVGVLRPEDVDGRDDGEERWKWAKAWLGIFQRVADHWSGCWSDSALHECNFPINVFKRRKKSLNITGLFRWFICVERCMPCVSLFPPTVLLSMCPRFLGLDVHVSATQTCVNIISALWSRSCRGRNADANDFTDTRSWVLWVRFVLWLNGLNLQCVLMFPVDGGNPEHLCRWMHQGPFFLLWKMVWDCFKTEKIRPWGLCSIFTVIPMPCNSISFPSTAQNQDYYRNVWSWILPFIFFFPHPYAQPHHCVLLKGLYSYACTLLGCSLVTLRVAMNSRHIGG